MAERGILHIKHLDEFSRYLKDHGYDQLPLSRNPYEVLRMRQGKNTIIVFRKMNANEHLSVMDKDIRFVRAFLKTKRKEQQ